MDITHDSKKLVTCISYQGEEHVFDLGGIMVESPIGVENKRYAGTVMLARLVQLKGPINSDYYRAKFALTKRFWKLPAEEAGLALNAKLTAKQLDIWMQAQPEYTVPREIRDFVNNTIEALTMVWLPRLRSFAEATQVGERQTAGAVPSQEPFPPLPNNQTPSPAAPEGVSGLGPR